MLYLTANQSISYILIGINPTFIQSLSLVLWMKQVK